MRYAPFSKVTSTIWRLVTSSFGIRRVRCGNTGLSEEIVTMGTIKIVAAAILLIGASAVAHAQSGAENAAQQPPRPTTPPVPAQEPGWLGDSLPPLWNRVYVNINAARQPQTWTFDSLNTFSSFGEEGTFETIQNVGIGTLLDASAGYHLARHFAVGGGFWTAVSKSAVAGTAAMPDPLVYGQYAIRTLDAS